MAKLHSLIKFKRHELDEKREALARLNDELDRLKQNKQQLLDDLAREKNLAAVDIDVARSFGPYLNRTLERCAQLDEHIRSKLQEVQAATHIVQDAYLEVKKLEVTQEKRDEEETSVQKKRENNTLDEIGLQSFRRGEEGRI